MLDLTALTARELSRQISAGELSPIAVVEAYLAKIRVMNGRLNAFVDVYEEQARREAERVQARVKGGQLLGPLHGVPIVIKDLFEGMARRLLLGLCTGGIGRVNALPRRLPSCYAVA